MKNPKPKINANDLDIIVRGFYRHKKTRKLYIYSEEKYFELVGLKCKEIIIDESKVKETAVPMRKVRPFE